MSHPNHLDARALLAAGIAAVDAEASTAAALTLDADTLRIGGQSYPLGGIDRLIVLGAGKAAAGMAAGVERRLGDRVHHGLVIVKDGYARPLRRIAVREASHPIPDQRGLDATAALLDLARDATAGDLVLCLISGGGSALLVAPTDELSLEALQFRTREWLRSGADIEAINAERQRVSAVKGGGLLRAIAPATAITLAISDVPGDPSVIASGPTAGSPLVVVADLDRALQAAAAEATRRGYVVRRAAQRLEGEAREVGARIARHPLQPGECWIAGGEVTVTLHGAGRGGRCQELALAAAAALEDDRVVLAAGTDGTDGPGDVAGAVVDRTTVMRGGDPSTALANHDAGTYLEATGDLIRTGPTGTNVADLVVMLRR